VYISEHGGMDRLLELRGLDSISINRFHYELISEDGDSEQTLARGEVTIEDAIFSELIDRLERGDSINSIPGSKIGDALKSVLAAAKEDKEEQRGMIARFVTALDPTLLERGLLSNRIIQRGMAWKAIRKIIDRLLANLPSPDPDTRHHAVSKLQDMSLLAVERGKENSTLQIIENVSMLLKREQDPDVLYKGVILIASLMEALLARGMMTIALEAGKILLNLESMHFSRTELEAARKRSLAEAKRKIDTIDAAEVLVQKILSEDETVAREARRLAMIAPQDNLVSQLVNIFHEDSRRLRARAFRMLLKMGNRGLSAIHRNLSDTVEAFNSQKDGATFSLPDTDWYKARNMIQVLRDIGSPTSESILAELCKVPDYRIRRECLLALTKVSATMSESLSMFLIMDKKKDVAEIALDILTKRAMRNSAFVPKITEAYRKNTDIRHEIMESFSILGNHQAVIKFISKCFQKEHSDMLGDDPDLIAGALRIIRRYGGVNELPVLKKLLHEVEGGFFKRSKIDKNLVQQLKDTIRNLRFSESVIESDDSRGISTRKLKEPVRPPQDDDEITILGPDYGINK
jgi:HEAT repeat protein